MALLRTRDGRESPLTKGTLLLNGRTIMNHRKQLVLNKGAEKFIFRYEEGNEGQLLDAFVASATDSQTDFDWFDAAVLSFKLTQSLIGEADEILYKDLNDPVKTYDQGS
jgi:hypothetical protein